MASLPTLNGFVTTFQLPTITAALQVSAQNTALNPHDVSLVCVTRSVAAAPVTRIQFYNESTQMFSSNISSNGQTASTTFLSPANEFTAPSAVTTTWSIDSGSAVCGLLLAAALPVNTQNALSTQVELAPSPSPSLLTAATLKAQRAAAPGVVFVCASPTGFTESNVPEFAIGLAGIEAMGADSDALLRGAGLAYHEPPVPAVTMTLSNTAAPYTGNVSGLISPNLVHALFTGALVFASNGGGAGVASAAFWFAVPNAASTAFEITMVPAEDDDVQFLASGLCSANVLCTYSGWGVQPKVWIADFALASATSSDILDVNAAAVNWSGAHMYEWPNNSAAAACLWITGDHTLLVQWNVTAVTFYATLPVPGTESITAISYVDASSTQLCVAIATRQVGELNSSKAYTTTYDTASHAWSVKTPLDDGVHLYTDIVSIAGSPKTVAGAAPAVSVLDRRDASTLWTFIWALPPLA